MCRGKTWLSTGSWWTWWTQQIWALFLKKWGRVKVGIPMICVSLSCGSTVTQRSALPAVLLFEQIKNNIFLNQIRNYCSFFLSWVGEKLVSFWTETIQQLKGSSPIVPSESQSKAVLLLSNSIFLSLCCVCDTRKNKVVLRKYLKDCATKDRINFHSPI